MTSQPCFLLSFFGQRQLEDAPWNAVSDVQSCLACLGACKILAVHDVNNVISVYHQRNMTSAQSLILRHRPGSFRIHVYLMPQYILLLHLDSCPLQSTAPTPKY
jgi:hypothetical protein